MTLGEKLKEARLAAGLSQRQLCGDRMTRNMLSQLENGSARPSMATLEYLAQQLGKPISWFLEESSVQLPGLDALADARAALSRGDFPAVKKALAQVTEPVFVEEKQLLTFLWQLEAGRQALQQNRLPYARELLKNALSLEGLYITKPLIQRCQVLLNLAGEFASLDADDEALLVRADQAPEPQRKLEILAACENKQSPRWQSRCAEALFVQKQYREAFDLFRQLPLTPAICRRLEDCCRELEDFKGAYDYARKLRELEGQNG